MNSNDLVDLVNNNIFSALSEVHTITIGKIVKVNTKTIDVKPTFKRKIQDREIEYPVFTNVPPIFLNGGANSITFPLSVGDDVLLMVNERCFDNWYEGLDNKTPLEYRFFDYSDSFALVGIQPKSKAHTIPTDGRTHQTGDTLAVGDYEQQGNYTRTGTMNMTGNFTLTGDLNVTGNINVVGNVGITSGDLTIDGVSFKTHTHPQNDGNDLGGGVNTGVAE